MTHYGPMSDLVQRSIEVLPWPKAYFTFGVLTLEPWEILARIKARLTDGGNADGEMAPEDVQAWWDLDRIQNQLMEGTL